MLEAIMNNLINIGVGNADLLGGVPVQCGLFPVLQYQNFASAF